MIFSKRKKPHPIATRIIMVILLLAFLNSTAGCKVRRVGQVSKEELAKGTEPIVEDIVEVVLSNGDVVKFSRSSGSFDRSNGVISGFVLARGMRVDLNIDDILYVRILRVHTGLSILATAGIVAATVAVIALIIVNLPEDDDTAGPQSCPFVYSYDGENYIFDAEPLGGAISEGLKKTDYSRLEHLKGVEGKYHLLLRNELDETQYTDAIKLLVVDHSQSSEIIPDLRGTFYSVEMPVAARFAVDEDGKDLMKFVKEQDGIAWQTHLPTDTSFQGQNLRHRLIFRFPKPPDAKTVKLVVNAGTGLWGSNITRKMLQLRGNRVDAWYEDVDKGGPELMKLIQFVEREELYVLKIHVKEGQSWVQRGFISGGGPLINEDRIIPLDVSNVPGDTLTIRLNPPMGFWAIDYIGVEYEDFPPPEVKQVPLASATDQYGEDVSQLLRTTDNKYQVLPEVGDWVKVSFDVPAEREGTKRSVFLETSGYYEIHILKDQPEQTDLIDTLLTTPGTIVEFAMNEYVKWRHLQLHRD